MKASRRLALVAAGLFGAAALASSCSFDAAVKTDRSGRVVALDGVRVQSTLHDFGLAMLVRSREFVVEFSWGRELARGRSVDGFAGGI